jgi:hypothetical protein
MRRALLVVAMLALAAQAAPAAAATPKVFGQIVGKSGTIVGSTLITPKAFSLRVSGRSCAVADATPLAVLEAMRKVDGPSYAVRDYGSCSKSIADSGNLFVRGIGSETNKGRDGWVYKVGRKGGSTGAADPSGPFGTGKRLKANDQVLWFWCVQKSSGCQRTLEITPAKPSAVVNTKFTVAVRGYDDQGRGKKIAGATVTLGGDSVTTDNNGRATLTAPFPAGRYLVFATAKDMVDAFPAQVVTRK